MLFRVNNKYDKSIVFMEAPSEDAAKGVFTKMLPSEVTGVDILSVLTFTHIEKMPDLLIVVPAIELFS